MFEGLWQKLYTAFLSNAANALVYLAIAALFVVCIVKCVAPMVNSKRLLQRAVRSIKKGESGKRSWQDEDFLGKGYLQPHWSEYLNNLFFADGEFHNPSNVEDFINEDTAIYGPGRATLSEAAPGVMVSLGFLGTLVGMSMGLSGFDMSNADAVMQSIPQLISGMKYAFNTSIVGVVASITFTLITRIVSGTALRALNNFYAAMSTYAGVLSVDPMTQIAIYQQEQTALIQTMAEDMAGAMAERMATAMAGAMDKAVSPLARSVEEFVHYASRDHVRGVEALVARFVQHMDQALGGQFSHLAATIDGVCRNQDQMQEGMRQAVDGMMRMSQDILQVQKISEDMLTQFDSYLTKLNGSHQMVEDGYARIAANVEHLEIIARQQNGYLQSVSKLQGEVIKALESFQVATDRFMNAFSENVQKTAEGMTRVSGEMKRNGDALAANQKALVEGVAKDIDKAYNTFFANVDKTTEQLHWLVEDVKTTLGKLPDLLDGTAGLYANQADRLTDALRRAQAALDDAVDRIIVR